MSGFADVYKQLCGRYPDAQDRGRVFEPMLTVVLRTDPQYQAHFAEVWPWNEWSGRYCGDISIVIVAKRHDGAVAAIQCEYQHRTYKRHIDSSYQTPSGFSLASQTRSGISSTPILGEQVVI